MAQDEFLPLRETLQEVLAATPMTARDIEDRLGIGHGMLRRLLDGSVELRLHHLTGFARLLEIDPRELLALESPEWTVRYRLIDWMSPQRRQKMAPALQTNHSEETAATIRAIVREELAHHGLKQEKAPSAPKRR